VTLDGFVTGHRVQLNARLIEEAAGGEYLITRGTYTIDAGSAWRSDSGGLLSPPTATIGACRKATRFASKYPMWTVLISRPVASLRPQAYHACGWAYRFDSG